MLKSRLAYAGLFVTLVAAPAFAQTANPAGTKVGTDISQQQQIEQGLKSGQLSTGEAARLEKGEQRIDNAESRALKNGTESPQEVAHIQQMQTNEENRINKLENNSVTGNPNSVSSQRMQADVQRNVNQEQRIENGVNNGSLTNKEAGKLEKGQAKLDRKEFRAGKDGNVNAGEQARIQKTANHQSKKIWHKKHNGNTTANP